MDTIKGLVFQNINIMNKEFQRAFREYFAEFGIPLKENTEVFNELMKAQDNEGMESVSLKNGNKLLGFILYQIEIFKSSNGFFEQKVGYIRELWIDKNYRKQNLGTKLMEEIYNRLRKAGVYKILLTYDEDAIGFYEKLGYMYDNSYSAKNKERCMVKFL